MHAWWHYVIIADVGRLQFLKANTFQTYFSCPCIHLLYAFLHHCMHIQLHNSIEASRCEFADVMKLYSSQVWLHSGTKWRSPLEPPRGRLGTETYRSSSIAEHRVNREICSPSNTEHSVTDHSVTEHWEHRPSVTEHSVTEHSVHRAIGHRTLGSPSSLILGHRTLSSTEHRWIRSAEYVHWSFSTEQHRTLNQAL